MSSAYRPNRSARSDQLPAFSKLNPIAKAKSPAGAKSGELVCSPSDLDSLPIHIVRDVDPAPGSWGFGSHYMLLRGPWGNPICMSPAARVALAEKLLDNIGADLEVYLERGKMVALADAQTAAKAKRKRQVLAPSRRAKARRAASAKGRAASAKRARARA